MFIPVSLESAVAVRFVGLDHGGKANWEQKYNLMKNISQLVIYSSSLKGLHADAKSKQIKKWNYNFLKMWRTINNKKYFSRSREMC